MGGFGIAVSLTQERKAADRYGAIEGASARGGTVTRRKGSCSVSLSSRSMATVSGLEWRDGRAGEVAEDGTAEAGVLRSWKTCRSAAMAGGGAGPLCKSFAGARLILIGLVRLSRTGTGRSGGVSRLVGLMLRW